MPKTKTIYVCQSCGGSSYKWLGRCPDCQAWNTFVEEKVSAAKTKGFSAGATGAAPVAMTGLDAAAEKRISTAMPEFDRVLGGGMVPGSAVLIGGDPGIGKSTLLLQAMGRFALSGRKALYVTGEESLRQIRLRAERLGVIAEGLLVYPEVSLERVIESIKEAAPDAVVIDSVQTLYSEAIESLPGSISQVREVASRLIMNAKQGACPVFLVGHVTKDGMLAGPKTLEHMVDTVLYFEGERDHAFRILRSTKNRFGPVSEIGVFEMREEGLKEVLNPSELFLAQRPSNASGSAVTASLEGTRTVLVEIQSLVCPTLFGMPRRTVAGVDYNKVVLLAAVLEKKASLALQNHDIFIKVAGGMSINEPAIDLSIVASIASNFLDKPIEPKTVIFGEVGLAGEVRAIGKPDQRIKEAARLGFTRCIMPKENLKGIKPPNDMKLTGVASVREAMGKFFEE